MLNIKDIFLNFFESELILQLTWSIYVGLRIVVDIVNFISTSSHVNSYEFFGYSVSYNLFSENLMA